MARFTLTIRSRRPVKAATPRRFGIGDDTLFEAIRGRHSGRECGIKSAKYDKKVHAKPTPYTIPVAMEIHIEGQGPIHCSIIGLNHAKGTESGTEAALRTLDNLNKSEDIQRHEGLTIATLTWGALKLLGPALPDIIRNGIVDIATNHDGLVYWANVIVENPLDMSIGEEKSFTIQSQGLVGNASYEVDLLITRLD